MGKLRALLARFWTCSRRREVQTARLCFLTTQGRPVLNIQLSEKQPMQMDKDGLARVVLTRGQLSNLVQDGIRELLK